jgi:5'-nucleotidase
LIVMTKNRWRMMTIGVVVSVVLALSAAACSSDDGNGGTAATTAPSTTAAPASLEILVTNDDGVGAPGIDALVQALVAQPDTEVTVVAPATNQSGQGSNTTDGPLTVTDAATASGYPAKAVSGFPADTIIWAIDQGGVALEPDLVISGINAGQNIGPSVSISGTVGAAMAAAARGIPALAASQGLAEPPDYPAGVDEVISWLGLHRDELLAGSATVDVDNLNVPTCPAGTVRGLVDAPVAPDLGERNPLEVDCLSTKNDFVDDVDAFLNGYAVLSDIPVDEGPPTTGQG